MDPVKRFGNLLAADAPLRDAIAIMGSSENNKRIAGIVVVVDASHKVVGVVTDGDIRRALAHQISLDAPLAKALNPNPLTVNRTLSTQQMRRYVIDEAKRRKANYMKYDKLILVEPDGSFFDVIRLSDIMEADFEGKTIAVYGMGFVGLTLACTLANAGLRVVGVDTNANLISRLQKHEAPFYEKGLDSMLLLLAQKNPIQYVSDIAAAAADIHIVSVGTPVDGAGKADMSALEAASRMIASQLKAGDLVLFRSTVPVGTIRQIALPVLEKSGLSCGKDFYLAFAPERTVEGNALAELRLLPQIVGGYDDASAQMAAKLFRYVTPTIIEVESLEAAEMVKLINNTFRDLVFAFANETAQICEAMNVNAFNLIRAANEGYPRDRIPLPSPGVGGICLSKDPHLYSQPRLAISQAPILGKASRQINGQGASNVLRKIEAFAKRSGGPLDSHKLLLIGLAFKGMPETSDTRGSIALDLLRQLPKNMQITVKDFVVPAQDIVQLGYAAETRELDQAVSEADVILVMNNHYRNNKFNVVQALRMRHSPTLFFDGWSQFDQREIEALSHVYYATLGYLTPGEAEKS